MLSSQQHPAKRKQIKTILAISFAICTFVLNYTLELHFDRIKVLDENNVLFDADPTRMAFSQGWDRRNLIHPNFSNFFNPPVRILAKIIAVSEVTDQPEQEIRRSVGLIIVPFFSGIKALLIFIFFCRLGLALFKASLITILSMVSFSQVIFGSIPEHFAISGFFILIIYFLITDLVKNGGRIRKSVWLLAGVLLGGITITNLVIFGLLLFIPLLFLKREFVKPCYYTGIMLLCAVAINLVIAFTMIRIFDLDFRAMPTFVKKFIGKAPMEKLAQSPSTLANTIAPTRLNTTAKPSPQTRLNNIVNVSNESSERYTYMFTLEGAPGIWSMKNVLGLVTIILVTAGAIKGLFAGILYRILAVSSVIVIAYNLFLHAVWGSEYFLYSQHWLFSIFILLSGIMLFKGRFRHIGNLLFSTFVVWVSINNGVRLYEMLSLLQG